MIDSKLHKKVLVAPLNWGLGHASRCIPIIEALSKFGFSPLLAGDGDSLELLKKEFPKLPYYELPSTKVTYPLKRSHLKIKLLAQAPKFVRAMGLEKEKVKEIHQNENLCGIISDNRFGVRSNEIPSVYISHQLKVLSGSTSVFSTSLHQKLIKKFDQCWVPDYESDRLAGDLSGINKDAESIKYIGPLSRFKRNPLKKQWDIVAVLSGPEPQRSLLEDKLKLQLASFAGRSLIVQGLLSEQQIVHKYGNTTLVNFMLSNELRDSIESGRMIISRSGYSSIMDLEALESKAFFIPTPGQFEQEYLAKYLENQKRVNFSSQSDFDLEKLFQCENYLGFEPKKTSNNSLTKSLFDVFL